uniref:Uncharacterized protein n=1 Tax=Pseudo-nitzschia australis TaxID=44445 RepID=A0A7S4EK54_9STRA|mmetsp:Transcript_27753/g.61124  ORF Transcript_27753/g.61124 Transcript_27753/m.61124 type:complete len:289 (+) Transcript_27753:100-966(+)
MKLPTCYPSSSASSASASASASSMVTILGLGSLLSERSSRTTFPDLCNFRLGRVSNRYRRVFGHPASIFFQRGLANMETKEISSLSAEEFDFCGNGDGGNGNNTHACTRGGFVCSVFEVPRDQVYSDETDSDGRIVATKPTGAFLEREEEFDITEVPYVEFSESKGDGDDDTAAAASATKMGVLCTRYTDEGFIERWGKQRFDENYGAYGIETIWGWGTDSGLLPCRVYLRHCFLAAKSMGPDCLDSFLDETFLADRTTTIRQYLQEREPDLVETTIPPPEVEGRYSG